jgi:hypothetical protein
VLVLVHDLHIRVRSISGELLRDLTVDPTRDYEPLRWRRVCNQRVDRVAWQMSSIHSPLCSAA